MRVGAFTGGYMVRVRRPENMSYRGAADAAFCVECARLRADSERLERMCAEAGDRFLCSAESASASRYNALRIASDEAQIDLQLARLQLEQHQRRHIMPAVN
jgi:hypothetical protein